MHDDLTGKRTVPRHPRELFRLALLATLGLVVLYLLGAWIYSAFIESSEAKIRKAILAAAKAAEERHPANVTRILTEDFKGPGGVTKDMAHQAFAYLLMTQFRQVEVALAPDPIPVTMDPADPHKGEAVFRAKVRGRMTEQAEWQEIREPNSKGTEFRCKFKRIDQGWQIYELTIGE